RKLQAHQRLALARTRADEDQIARLEPRIELCGWGLGGRQGGQQAPGGEAFAGSDLVECRVQGDACAAGEPPGVALQTMNGGGWRHVRNLLLRASIAIPPYAWRSNSRFGNG